jgi:hypothetical protein
MTVSPRLTLTFLPSIFRSSSSRDAAIRSMTFSFSASVSVALMPFSTALTAHSALRPRRSASVFM